MKNTKLTRSLLAACSIVALSVVVYGCDSGPSQDDYDAVVDERDAAAAAQAMAEERAAAAERAQARAEAAAAAAAQAQTDAEAATAAAVAAQADAEAKAAADVAAAAAAQMAAEAAAMAAAEAEQAAKDAAAAQADADAAAVEAANAAAAAAADRAAAAATEAAEAKAAAHQAAADLAAAETARMAAEAAAEAAKMAQMEAEEALRMAEGERDDARDALDDRDDDDTQATARALKRALGAMPLMNLHEGGSASLDAAGRLQLSTRRPATDTTTDIPTPRMAPGDSAGMLGDWAGTDYANVHPVTGVSHSARAYRNRADADMTAFALGATFGGTEAAFAEAYTRATRTLALGATASAYAHAVAGDMFPSAGTTTYPSTAVIIPGTYQGAQGDYYCGGTAGSCAATRNADGSIAFTGAWSFVHDVGAMVTSPDSNYLYFGWWINKDGTGAPVSVSAFTSVAGTVNVPMSDTTTVVSPTTGLTGSAKYAGHAAGKFAISNPIGDDSGGHFTADAELTAVFAVDNAGGGISGMLDNFMLNDEEPEQPWSVTLIRRNWGTDAGDATDWTADTGLDDPDTSDIDESAVGTIWSIGGNPAEASGSWSATMYDETADGNHTPTTVTGTFESDFGDIITMVGAFGAKRE